MRKRTKKKIVRTILAIVITLTLMVVTGRSPAFIKNIIDKIVPKASEITRIVGQESKDTLEDLKQAYLEYTSSENTQTSNTTTSLSVVLDGLEIPKGGSQTVQYNGYTLSYNTQYKQADWVAYTLDIEELNTKATGRTDDFREDPKVNGAHLIDYKNSGYDRGHLCPSADRTSSVELCSETYLLSNMSPQIHRFNAGLWLKAEDATRDAARMYEKIYIATGPVFTNDMDTIGSCCQIAVPKSFYKVILAFDSAGNAHAIALVCPQEYEKGNLSLYVTTVDAVEELTGLDFFYNLEDSIENVVEATYSLKDWPKSFSN